MMVQLWRRGAQRRMRAYAAVRAQIDELEAEANRLLGEAVQAYEWLDEVVGVNRMDTYRTVPLGNYMFGEDVAEEVAMANRSSQGVAEMLVDQVATLMHDMPQCWAKVCDPQIKAPLWQARLILGKCAGLKKKQLAQVDASVSLGLGTLAWGRLARRVSAAVKRADPDGVRLKAKSAERSVRVQQDRDDASLAWVNAHIGLGDALRLDDTLAMIAARLGAEGDTDLIEQRRATAFAMLADPVALVERFGLAASDAPVATPPAPAFTPPAPTFTSHTRVYVHVWADSLGDPDEVARLEGYDPVLLDQVKALTAASSVKLTKVVHVGADSVALDAYEVPDWMHEALIARDVTTKDPWSATEARHQDRDHIREYQPGLPGQTRLANLVSQRRGWHRCKTVAGFHVRRTESGAYLWTTAAGQRALVDQIGTHPLPLRE